MAKCMMCGQRPGSDTLAIGGGHHVEVPVIKIYHDSILGNICSDCIGMYYVATAKERKLKQLRYERYGVSYER